MINIRTPFDKVYGEITLIQMIININKNSKTKDYSPLYNELRIFHNSKATYCG